MLTNSSYTGLNSKSTTFFFPKSSVLMHFCSQYGDKNFFALFFPKRVINGFRPQAKRWPPPESFATEKESFFPLAALLTKKTFLRSIETQQRDAPQSTTTQTSFEKQIAIEEGAASSTLSHASRVLRHDSSNLADLSDVQTLDTFPSNRAAR